MVKTRSQAAKADTENTKRSRGGSGGGADSGGSDMDELAFREFLASIFPSNFANQQVAAARKRAGSSKDRQKRRKIRKTDEESDVSSCTSCEEDVASPKAKCVDGQAFVEKDGKKFYAFTAVNGVLRPIKKGENPANAMKSHMRDTKKDAKKHRVAENCSDDSSPDYDPDEDDDWNTVSDDEGASSEDTTETEDDMECEGDTMEEMFDADANPEECSDYEDDDETPEPVAKGIPSRSETTIPNIELDVAEKEFNSIVDGTPKVFQKKCQNIWREFKTKLENERKQFVAKGKKMEKKARHDNLTSFRKMLREGDTMNDLRYFNRFLSLDEQQKTIAEMERVKACSQVDTPYRIRLLDAPIPPRIKAVAMKKINALRHTSPGDGEHNKLKKWVDAFLQIPFGVHSKLDLTLTDGQDRCHSFMENAQRILDEAVYGLDDVKLQVIQMLGQWISNPQAVGSAMAIHGPMGTGKTTLVKDGISKILGREFIFIALGGATDSSFLEGHSYTYEGSTWGKIVDLLMQCKTMNPIIYFDELDKVSDTPRGEEIIGILTHLTDTSQNDRFHDKYFSEVEFDLSKCMFFFSYNDPERVNPILRDRMYTIKTNGYSSAEKVTIAEKHLLPKLLPQVGFNPEQVAIPTSVLDYIVKEYTSDDEKGVRSLKRRLEIIMTKLNLYRILKPGTTMFGQKIPDTVEFPMTVTEELVRELLKKEKKDDTNHWVMYT